MSGVSATTDVTHGGASRRPSLALVLVAASTITALSLGIRSTFGLFLTPMTEALHTNRAGFALATTCAKRSSKAPHIGFARS